MVGTSKRRKAEYSLYKFSTLKKFTFEGDSFNLEKLVSEFLDSDQTNSGIRVKNQPSYRIGIRTTSNTTQS